MTREARRTAAWLGLVALVAGAAGPRVDLKATGYSPDPTSSWFDTLKPKTIPHPAMDRGVIIVGYLSARGLPPVPGRFTVTDTGLVFQSASGASHSLSGPLPEATGQLWRATTVSLAYVEGGKDRRHYLFRVDAGVFETEMPGPLLELAAHPGLLGGVRDVRWSSERSLVDAGDSLGLRKMSREIASSPYADSLYVLFGQPRAPIGLIGSKGRMAGRLGEYIASRDSLALDLGRITSAAQLRHALAHELGHRWQARAKAQMETLWLGVGPIRDPKRYGYGSRVEQQAEAIAFAINFLQITAGTTESVPSSLTLLEHYELLVPGTRAMAQHLIMQPTYRLHPLRRVLLATSPTQLAAGS